MKAAVPRPGHPARPAGHLPLLGQPAAPRRGGVQLRGGLHAAGPQDIISVLPAGGSSAAVLQCCVLQCCVLQCYMLQCCVCRPPGRGRCRGAWRRRRRPGGCGARRARTRRASSSATSRVRGHMTRADTRHVTREACRRGAALRLPPRLHPVRGRPHV